MKYPIFVVSSERPENNITADNLKKEKIDYIMVVPHNQVKEYKKHNKKVLGSTKGVYQAMNYCMRYARARKFKWCWILDDDIVKFYPPYNFKKAMTKAETYTIPQISVISFKHKKDFKTLKPLFFNTDATRIVLVNLQLKMNYNESYKLLADTEWIFKAVMKGFPTLILGNIKYYSPPNLKQEGGASDLYKAKMKIVDLKKLKQAFPTLVNIKDGKDSRGLQSYSINWNVLRKDYLKKFTLPSLK